MSAIMSAVYIGRVAAESNGRRPRPPTGCRAVGKTVGPAGAAAQSHDAAADPLTIDGGGFGAAIHCLKPHLVRSTFDSCRAGAIEGHSG